MIQGQKPYTTVLHPKFLGMIFLFWCSPFLVTYYNFSLLRLQPIWWYLSRRLFHKDIEEWSRHCKGTSSSLEIARHGSNRKPSMYFPGSLLWKYCFFLGKSKFRAFLSSPQVTDADLSKEATPREYITKILPVLLRNGVVHFLGFGNRLGFDPLPNYLQVQIFVVVFNHACFSIHH